MATTVKLLYLGAISESKGFLKVLDVFKELQRLFPQQLTIDIAGEFADTESKLRFENLVSEKQRKTSVRYHRRVLGMKNETPGRIHTLGSTFPVLMDSH